MYPLRMRYTEENYELLSEKQIIHYMNYNALDEEHQKKIVKKTASIIENKTASFYLITAIFSIISWCFVKRYF